MGSLLWVVWLVISPVLLLNAPVFADEDFEEREIELGRSVGWVPNVVPRNIVVFIDDDGDEAPDSAWALGIHIDHPIVCSDIAPPEKGELLFTTCGGGEPVGYVYITTNVGWRCHSCTGSGFIPVGEDPSLGFTLEPLSLWREVDHRSVLRQ